MQRITLDDLAALTRTEAEIKAAPELKVHEPTEIAETTPLADSKEYREAEYKTECDGAMAIAVTNCVTPYKEMCTHHAEQLLELVREELRKVHADEPQLICDECGKPELQCWSMIASSLSFTIAHPELWQWAYHSQE